MIQDLAQQLTEGTEALPVLPGSSGVHSAEVGSILLRNSRFSWPKMTMLVIAWYLNMKHLFKPTLTSVGE